jgi:pSer/pThr/pTyr-binding forkhead associated (FHA) protein
MSPHTARLEVVAGNATGMSIVVEDELLIGRHAQGAGRLADDAEISRSHARVTLEGSGFCAVEDLGSTNGTFVNGLRINGPATLSEGDTIELGSTTLVVRELPVSSADGGFERAPRGATVATGDALAAADEAAMDDAPTEAQDPVAAGEPDAQPGMFIGLAPAIEELTTPPEAAEGGAETRRGASPLRLGLEIDFEAQEARIFLSDDGDLIRIGFSDGEWQVMLPPPE